MKTRTIFLLCSALMINPVIAALTLDISGSAGNANVMYTASGSVILTEDILAFSSSTGAAPLSDRWDTAFDNNLGDLFQTGVANDNNRTLSSAISYQLNAVEFSQIEAFDLTTSDTAGGDDFQIDMVGTSGINYPELSVGDVISWTGSGTFVLSSETYDTFFTSGVYTAPLNGGNYVVNIAPIPEPSSLVFLGLAGVAVVLRRHKEVN